MRSALSVLVGFGLVASSASAQQVFTFDATTGNFNNPDNWDRGTVPTANDRIVIPDDSICTVTANATIDTMEVEANGTLNVAVDITLTLENDDHIVHVCEPISPGCYLSDDSIVDGTVELLDDDEGSGSTLKFVTKTHVVAGDGIILASSTTGSKIQIAGDIALKNQLDAVGKGIVGAMTIEGLSGTTDGTIFNQGRIEAQGSFGSGPGITVDAELDDIAGALWLAGCKSILGFERGSTELDGDFSNDVDDDGFGEPGQFTFHADVRTCGAYVRTCGAIDVDEANGVTFEYAEFVDLTDGVFGCGNPGTSEFEPATCEDPYVVGSDVSSGISCE